MQPATTVEGFRLSPQQRRLWSLQNASSSARAFCSQLVLSFEGDLRIEALRGAVESVCHRHEALRTRFRRLPGVAMPVQSVEAVAPSWQTLDLTGTDAIRVAELIEAETSHAFDYENGPLVYATLFTLSSEQHLLSITVPSLCADRRTLNNFFVELGRCYESVIEGRAADDASFQYVQFSEWQNSLWEEDDAANGKEFWSKQDLSHVSAILPGQRSAAASSQTTRFVALNLLPGCATHIARLAAEVETSVATILLAAWQTLLWRLTRRSIVIASVSDSRSYDLLRDAFGLFARALPVSSQLNEGLRFAEVAAQIESFQREAEEWQDYFDGEQRFSFGFEYATLPRTSQQLNLQTSVYGQRFTFEPFDLKLTCLSTESNLDLTFDYNVAAFEDAYVRQLAEQFVTLLDAALANPETPIDKLEIVSRAERQRIVFEWNNTKRDYSLDHCVHELFERQVERTPHALAAAFQDQQLTFAELNQRANQLAHYLRAQSVGPEIPVGIRIEPSLEMIVAMLGVLKAGGAYVPFDPRNPEARIRQVTEDAGISIVVTKEEVKKSSSESAVNFETDTRPENLAYIIYTSGSTGLPKGVMVQHRSVVNLASALREEVYAGLGSALRVALSAPLAFDASVKQLMQLLSGHTLYILPEEMRLDAVRGLDYFDRNAIDVLDCTPSQLKLLLHAGLNKDARHTPKLMLVGGEALDESMWSQLAADGRSRFFNVYGPTECTVDSTWTPVTDTAMQPTLGRPIPNARTYILDDDLKPAAIHLLGELCVGGEGVARGYLNSPERTAERFIPDALSGEPGARLYRTGDLARYAADGSIIFAGRNDTQVKVRGHRIELGEIEAALRRHEHVREAVVVARADTRVGADTYSHSHSDVRLVGYVVAENGNAPDVAELRKMLSEGLPDYMLPSFLIVLDELPLTRNGKVDVKALPAPETISTSRNDNYVAPRNEIEVAITRVWQDALGVERIGVNDNFFDAGGHSLLMVQVHSKLSEMFDKNISIVEMFAKPTISALAEHFSEPNGHQPTFEKVLDRAARRRQAVSTRQ